jgi:hypothetical protein
VRGFEESEATVLAERDATCGQFDFQQVAVVPGTHEDGLVPQPHAVLDVRQDLLGDPAGFGGRVIAADQPGLGSVPPIGIQAHL